MRIPEATTLSAGATTLGRRAVLHLDLDHRPEREQRRDAAQHD